MSERFFRTFRVAEEDAGPFDALLQQRDRRIGVTVGTVWDDTIGLDGADELAALLTDDLGAARDGDASEHEGPGHVVWIPPRVTLPRDEPYRSNLRVALGRGLEGLAPGERREVRLPVILRLAKIQADGRYMSVSGVLSREWTRLSEGVDGAYHLDARTLFRLPGEPAERDIIVSRVRDRAALLNPQEVTDVEVHDYWRVSRLPAGAAPGVTLIGSPPDVDPQDGTLWRRHLRRHVRRAVEQRRAGNCDLAVLALVASLGHIEDELATSALRGMNPVDYGALDLVVLIADAQVRQVLQPRSLPWEQPRT